MDDTLAGIDTNLLNVVEEPVPENACVKYERCRNVVPGRGEVCGNCLDKAQKHG